MPKIVPFIVKCVQCGTEAVVMWDTEADPHFPPYDYFFSKGWDSRVMSDASTLMICPKCRAPKPAPKPVPMVPPIRTETGKTQHRWECLQCHAISETVERRALQCPACGNKSLRYLSPKEA